MESLAQRPNFFFINYLLCKGKCTSHAHLTPHHSTKRTLLIFHWNCHPPALRVCPIFLNISKNTLQNSFYNLQYFLLSYLSTNCHLPFRSYPHQTFFILLLEFILLMQNISVILVKLLSSLLYLTLTKLSINLLVHLLDTTLDLRVQHHNFLVLLRRETPRSQLSWNKISYLDEDRIELLTHHL